MPLSTAFIHVELTKLARSSDSLDYPLEVRNKIYFCTETLVPPSTKNASVPVDGGNFVVYERMIHASYLPLEAKEKPYFPPSLPIQPTLHELATKPGTKRSQYSMAAIVCDQGRILASKGWGSRHLFLRLFWIGSILSNATSRSYLDSYFVQR